MSGVHDLPSNSAAVRVFRIDDRDLDRWYTPVPFADGRDAFVRALQRAAEMGHVADSSLDGNDDCYAVLDLLRGDSSVVDSYVIPTSEGFNWWQQMLGCEGPYEEPVGTTYHKIGSALWVASARTVGDFPFEPRWHKGASTPGLSVSSPKAPEVL